MIRKTKHFLMELADYYRLSFKIPEEERRLIFYAEHRNYYPNFEGLLNSLMERYGQSLCYITSEANDPILRKKEPKLKTFYLDKLLPFFMAFVNCKVFVMTMPDLNKLHIKRSVNPVQYVYIFHSLVSSHMVYLDGAFDHYDVLFCGGPHHLQEIRKRERDNGLAPKKLIETGFYRLERIYEAYKKYKIKNVPVSSKGIILIAPSWGPANILESCGEKLIELLLKENYEVIVRPHPETVKRNPQLIKGLGNKFGKNSKFTLEKDIVSDDSLLKADVLICDCSGIAFEYAFGTGRPVLFLNVPKKIRNDRYKDLGIEPLEIRLRSEMGKILEPEKINEVPQEISKLIESKDYFQKHLSELRNQNVYNFGRSSEIGADVIIELLNSGVNSRQGVFA